jgi:hypothetical protein
MPKRSELIDHMIASTPDWRGATLAELRRVIRKADPEITENVKWIWPSNPLGSAVFEHNGMVCLGILLKERVRLSLAEGAKLPDPAKLFNAQLESSKSRAIDFYEGDRLDEAALKALIRAGVEHNLAKVKPARKRES